MKCLMIRPEFVSEILAGEKKEEYRNWKTNFRGDFFIGCCATKESKGFLAGVAELMDCVKDEEEGDYVWQLENVRTIKPIPIIGKQRLFETEIDSYEIITKDDEIDAAYDDAEKWMLKEKR